MYDMIYDIQKRIFFNRIRTAGTNVKKKRGNDSFRYVFHFPIISFYYSLNVKYLFFFMRYIPDVREALDRESKRGTDTL